MGRTPGASNDHAVEMNKLGFKATARGLCQMVPSGDPPCNKCAAIEAALRAAYEHGKTVAYLINGAVLMEWKAQ